MRAVPYRFRDVLQGIHLGTDRAEKLTHLRAAKVHDRVELRALRRSEVQLLCHAVSGRPITPTVVSVREDAVTRISERDSADESGQQKKQCVALGALHRGSL